MSTLRAHRREVLLALAIVVLAIIVFVATRSATAGSTEETGAHALAVISQDGEPVQTIDLDTVSEAYEFRVEHGGGYNLVRVEPGRIRVIDADCPDGVCMGMGWIDRPGIAIACVPHRLTITIQQDGSSAPDATTR